MDKMLKIKLLSFVVCVLICFNTHGQNICIGKIMYKHVYNTSDAVLGLQSGFNEYFLTINSHRIEYNDKLIIEDTEYFVGDNVIITGAVTIKPPLGFGDYLELEIETIEKLSSNRDIQYFLGTYEIQIDCTNPWWIGDKATLSIIEETDTNAAFDFRLLFIGQPGSREFSSYVLKDNLFVIGEWGYYESGEISGYISGEGYKKNDSIFINLKQYDYDRWMDKSLVLSKDCHCKGKEMKLSDINSQTKSDNKVYFDATNQLIIIDETLKDQGVTFELTDIQGKAIFRKATVADNFINVADLPNGVYLYRLLQGNQTAYSGKIIKQ